MAKSIKISDEYHKKVNELAKKERRSRKTIIERALENFFKCKGVYDT